MYVFIRENNPQYQLLYDQDIQKKSTTSQTVDLMSQRGIDVKNVKLFFYMLGSMREAGVPGVPGSKKRHGFFPGKSETLMEDYL